MLVEFLRFLSYCKFPGGRGSTIGPLQGTAVGRWGRGSTIGPVQGRSGRWGQELTIGRVQGRSGRWGQGLTIGPVQGLSVGGLGQIMGGWLGG